MRILLAQINLTVGDIPGNLDRIRASLERGQAQGAELVLFPELTLCGYPPRDLLERQEFLDSSLEALQRLVPHTREIAAVVGLALPTPESTPRRAYNAAAFVADGEVLAIRHKTLLPTYDVFDEDRYFEAGTANAPVSWRGVRFGITICEDLWNDRTFWTHARYPLDPVEHLVAQGVDVLLNLSASPYQIGKPAFRQEMLRAAARRHRCPILLVNQVGGNDELIFDGHSVALAVDGSVVVQAEGFEEAHPLVELSPAGHLVAVTSEPSTGAFDAPIDEATELLTALELGLRDYVQKCGFRQVVLGLSGGIDSAVTAAIAAAALGPEQVLGVALPSRYSSKGSLEDAQALAHALGIRYEVLSIEPLFGAGLETLAPLFEELPGDTTEENLQSRCRGVLLMALSNKLGHLLLTTGNKSELAVGYCTLYGDMCGALAVISDLTKQRVYAVAHAINARAGRELIPRSTLTKAPSAELRPDQVDQDSLPPYEILDPILEAYVEQQWSVEQIVARGFDRALVVRVARLLEGSEYKRRQAAPGLKVTGRAFGMGRRYPVAQRFRSGARGISPESP